MNRAHARRALEAWAVWIINGGWDYCDAIETDEGMKIRAPGTHSDPTLSRLMAMERLKQCESARVNRFIGGLPKLQRALVFETYVQPLHDNRSFTVAPVLVAWGISSRVYYDQMRQVMQSLGWFLELKEGHPPTEAELAAVVGA